MLTLKAMLVAPVTEWLVTEQQADNAPNYHHTYHFQHKYHKAD
jgi:hypothetical protein